MAKMLKHEIAKQVGKLIHPEFTNMDGQTAISLDYRAHYDWLTSCK